MSREASAGGPASAEMTFWDHLHALRGVLWRGVAAVLVVSVGLFCVMPELFERVILAPCRGDFPLYRLMDRLSALMGSASPAAAERWSMGLINTQLASQLFVHISASVQGAVVVCFPLLLWLVWGFVSPALYAGERRYASVAFVAACGLFYIGMAVGYWLVFPMTLRFLAGYQLSEAIVNTITLDSYMDNFIGILFVMGLVFEIPLVAWVLGRVGMLSRSVFGRYRRHAVVALVVAAAVITPTSDPLTLAVVFVPLYLLWEVSALLVPKSKRVEELATESAE